MDALAGALLLIGAFALYLLPTIVAASRGHPNAGAICVLNLFLGWTLLGWVGALVWASIAIPPPPPATPRPTAPMF